LGQAGSKAKLYDGDLIVPLSENQLPVQIENWQLNYYEQEDRATDSDLGLRSDIWQYQTPQGVSMVSLDQPFYGWHELSVCYVSRGWKQQSRTRIDSKVRGTQIDWPYVQAEFVKATGEHGFLLFSHSDIGGKPFEPPEIESVLKSFLLRLQNLTSSRVQSRLVYGQAYQSQVFISSPAELDGQAKQEIRERYLSIREILRSQFENGTIASGRLVELAEE